MTVPRVQKLAQVLVNYLLNLQPGEDFSLATTPLAEELSLALRRRARSGLFKRMLERMATGELKWCATVYSTHAGAQDADMSLREYQDFVYSAGMLDVPDPVAACREEDTRQQRLIAWLGGKDQVTLKGKDVDLRLSLSGRSFLGASGKENFPDGEIYTSPVEGSVNGWIRSGGRRGFPGGGRQERIRCALGYAVRYG